MDTEDSVIDDVHEGRTGASIGLDDDRRGGPRSRAETAARSPSEGGGHETTGVIGSSYDAGVTGDYAGDLYGPTLRSTALLTREEEQALGRTTRECRLQLSARLARVPAAVGVIIELMVQANAGERPITDALFAPFDDFEGLEQVAGGAQGAPTDAGGRTGWRHATATGERLYREWLALVRYEATSAEVDGMRRRLEDFALRLRPSFYALGEALRVCNELDRRAQNIEVARSPSHCTAVDAHRPSSETAQTEAQSCKARRCLLRIRAEAGVDLATLRDCCRAASSTHARYIIARDRMVEANLRLAYFMAHRLRGNGVALDDLVQEAILGLMRAVDKFDYRMGCKFSTYAVQWIRQSTSRAIADGSRTIRVAAHVHDDVVRLRKVSRGLQQRLGREPSTRELAEADDLPQWKVERALKLAHEPLSLNAPLALSDDAPLSSAIGDPSVEDPRIGADRAKLSETVSEILDRLPPREALIIRLRHGIDGTGARTLDEIGRMLGITRERTRQLESRAFERLRERVSPKLLRGLEG